MSIFYFCCLLDNIKVYGCLVWVCFCFFFLVVKCVQQKRLLCKKVIKLRDVQIVYKILSQCFSWNLFYLLHLSHLTNLLPPICLLQPDPHESFWKIHGARYFELLVNHFSALASFFPPSLTRGSTSFPQSSLQW